MRLHHRYVLSFASIALMACTQAQPRSAPTASQARPARLWVAGPTYEFVNGRGFNGSTFDERSFYSVNGVLRVERPQRVDSAIDLKQGYVIPPFGDAHTHNLDGPFNLDARIDAYVREGTFYVQVLTNSRSGAERVRSRFNRPCALDVQYANGGVSATLSHPFLAYEPRAMGLYDGSQWRAKSKEIWLSRKAENDSYWFVDDSAAFITKWPKILEGSPDVIKIILLDASETAAPPPDTGLSSGHGLKPSLVPLIVRSAHAAGVRSAHAAGLRVAAHIETARDFEIGVESGVDLFAHAPGYEMGEHESVAAREISDAAARLAGQRKVIMIPTASLMTLVVRGQDSAQLVAQRRELLRKNLATLLRHNVRIAIGSDWYGQTARREYDALRTLGVLDDLALLKVWVETTPQSIFPRRAIGRLEEGYEASFLVLPTDPLRDSTAISRIQARVKQGCLVA